MEKLYYLCTIFRLCAYAYSLFYIRTGVNGETETKIINNK